MMSISALKTWTTAWDRCLHADEATRVVIVVLGRVWRADRTARGSRDIDDAVVKN